MLYRYILVHYLMFRGHWKGIKHVGFTDTRFCMCVAAIRNPFSKLIGTLFLHIQRVLFAWDGQQEHRFVGTEGRYVQCGRSSQFSYVRVSMKETLRSGHNLQA